ncbi:MAG: metallophosphoesterase [Desulfobacterales bacterium]|nr:metallophosphoesterase [Desulfobacterales bacterium]
MKKYYLRAGILLAIIFVFAVTIAGAGTGPIKQLPGISQNSQFSFTVFGDTRTSASGSTDGHDVVFQLAREEVFKAVGETLDSGRALFSLFTGDLIWQGGEAGYWTSPASRFPNALRTRIYPIPGNHETWNDPLLKQYFSFFPQLEDNHSYYFTCGNSLFISLCTGGYIGEYSKAASFAQDQEFTCIKAGYADLDLPDFLIRTADAMAAAGTPLKNIFMQYHKPSFSYYKHPPLNKENDPVEALKAFSKNRPGLQMVVFNGHNHTTELYQPTPNISVLVAGGGGAPQKTLSDSLPSDAVKAIYKAKGVDEIFWKALGSTTEDRTQRINYWVVDVDNTTNTVRVTEKVMRVAEAGPVFVDGLVMVNGGFK